MVFVLISLVLFKRVVARFFDFSSWNIMDIKTKRWLAIPMISAALMACGEGSNKTDKDAEVVDDKLVVNTQFAATYLQTIEKEQPAPVAFKASLQNHKSAHASQSKSYDGKLQVTNINTDEQQSFDWPMTQKVDSEGNVETISHRALTLKPGSYNFVLIATAKDAKKSQYVAEALGEEIVDGETPEINFVLKPNLGDTISDFDQVQYASTLNFSWPAEDLVSLSNPQFGLSLNGSDETVYTINKETGIAEALIFVEPGEYTLAMRLYDGDLMVGKNQDENNTINFVEGEDAKMDVIPLQADVELDLGELKDQGTFTFTVPKEVVTEVGSAEQLALIVRLGGKGAPLQEKVLDVYDDNGTYKASALFETGGQDAVSAYLAFHEMSEAARQFDGVPFAKCDTSINVALNQTLGCKLELKRESIVTGRVLGTLMLSVLDQSLQPAIGAEVYVDDKLVGLTGDQYSTGSIKLHLVAGEHEIKAVQDQWAAGKSVDVQPLSVMNELLYLESNIELGEGFFEHTQSLSMPVKDTHYNKLADINNDGHLDLLSSGTDGYGVIFLNNGQGVFNRSSRTFGTPNGIDGLAIGDFNNDGYIDIATLASQRLRIELNDGNGQFTLVHSYPETKRSLAVGDLNNNGRLDLIVGASHIFYNLGNGSFNSEPQDIGVYKYHLASVADLNDDNINDIILQGSGVKPLIKFGDGLGEFIDTGARLSEYEPDVNDVFQVAISDLDQDGDMDVLVYLDGYQKNTPSQVYLNNGKGEFIYSGWNVGTNANSLVAHDFNSDGLVDIIYSRFFGAIEDSVHILMNKGDGIFEKSGSISLSTKASRILVGDLDSDGDLDLNMVDTSVRDNAHNIYLNQPAP